MKLLKRYERRSGESHTRCLPYSRKAQRAPSSSLNALALQVPQSLPGVGWDDLPGGYLLTLAGCNGDCIRTGTCVRFTDLIGICSNMLMDIYLEVSVIGRRPFNSTIPQYVDLAAISRAPIQNHKPVTALSADMRRSVMSPPPPPASARMPQLPGSPKSSINPTVSFCPGFCRLTSPPKAFAAVQLWRWSWLFSSSPAKNCSNPSAPESYRPRRNCRSRWKIDWRRERVDHERVGARVLNRSGDGTQQRCVEGVPSPSGSLQTAIVTGSRPSSGQGSWGCPSSR